MTDTESDYQNLKPGQLFNHFPNNRELTTKAGLCKNIKISAVSGIAVDTFFPRCYDLSDVLDEFVADYEKTAVENIIKNHSTYFQSNENPTYINKRLLKLAIKICENSLSAHYDTCKNHGSTSFQQLNRREFSFPAN